MHPKPHRSIIKHLELTQNLIEKQGYIPALLYLLDELKLSTSLQQIEHNSYSIQANIIQANTLRRVSLFHNKPTIGVFEK